MHVGAQEKMKKILIVDDEEDMIWSLQQNINNELLQVEIFTAPTGEDALPILNGNHIDLVLSDIRMPGMSGLDLLLEIKNRFPYTQVIIMTAFPSNEFKKEALLRGSLHFIEKPFDIKELRDLIRFALREENVFKGTVAGVGLSDVIQINCLSRTTSVLRVKEGENLGIIYFQEGQVVHAICGELEGVEAFYRILEFRGGRLDSTTYTDLPGNTIDVPVEALIIEAARRMDEAGFAGVGDVDLEPANAQAAVMPREVAKINKDPGSAVDGGTGRKTAAKEDDMSSLKEVLAELTNVPGVNTACLVGRDGFLLDSIAIAGIDTEMIGAIASSGFGASESMGNQLGKGGMSMSMIEYANGPVMLSPVGQDAFLVIVAEKEANLGMIRLKIKKHTSQIAESAAI
jgi:predicted regulator of Ras-like GTPase activity (Roadblock/LC7/MglB family)/DNA-binding LytR/AlgR family response regulator